MRLRGLSLLFGLLPGLALAADTPKPWLPEYVESAEVVRVTGHCDTYVQPGQTHKLLGFVFHPPEHEGRPPVGIVEFDNGIDPAEFGGRKINSAAVMAAAPLKQHRIVRRPGSKKIKGIELRAEYKSSLGGSALSAQPDSSSPPVRATETGERQMFRTITRVNIQPGSRDPRQGRMWIVHEDDLRGGFVYAIQLKCVLNPELLPQE